MICDLSFVDDGESYETLELNAQKEELLGCFLRDCLDSTDNLVIATKLVSYSTRVTRCSTVNAVDCPSER